MCFVGNDEIYLVVVINSSELRMYDLFIMNCLLLEGYIDIVLVLEINNVGDVLVIGFKVKVYVVN